MKTRIEIKSIRGSVLFSYESEDNSIKKTLEEAVKVDAYLSRAYLSGANLSDANLSGADLSGANLSRAYLSGANLSRAYLSGANLSRAYLSGADLSGASHNEGTAFFESQCPSEGSFVAWKKASGKIVKLLVAEDAKRSSATTLKCRCSKARVLGIEEINGEQSNLKQISSDRDSSFIYKVGEIVEVQDFDENRWNECSTGIHFFISRNSAVKYN